MVARPRPELLNATVIRLGVGPHLVFWMTAARRPTQVTPGRALVIYPPELVPPGRALVIYPPELVLTLAFVDPLGRGPTTVIQTRTDGAAPGPPVDYAPLTGTARADAERQARRLLAATARARRLLIANLTVEQRAELLEHDRITVTGSSGGRYRILRARERNVWRLDGAGRARQAFCLVVAGGWVPDEDVVLAQKLLLEADEPAFLAKANRVSRARRRAPSRRQRGELARSTVAIARAVRDAEILDADYEVRVHHGAAPAARYARRAR